MSSPASASDLKEEGNSHFAAGRIAEAFSAYLSALETLKSSGGDEPALAAAVHNNAAACCLKLERPADALTHCDAALVIDPLLVKVRFVRGRVLLPGDACGRFSRVTLLQYLYDSLAPLRY